MAYGSLTFNIFSTFKMLTFGSCKLFLPSDEETGSPLTTSCLDFPKLADSL